MKEIKTLTQIISEIPVPHRAHVYALRKFLEANKVIPQGTLKKEFVKAVTRAFPQVEVKLTRVGQMFFDKTDEADTIVFEGNKQI